MGQVFLALKYDATHAVDSKKLEPGRRMIYSGCPSLFGLRFEDSPVPTFWLLL